MRKILLYLSAFIPLYFLVIIKILIDIILGNLHFNVLNTSTLIILSSAIFLGIKGIYYSTIKNQTKITEIMIIEKTSGCNHMTCRKEV